MKDEKLIGLKAQVIFLHAMVFHLFVEWAKEREAAESVAMIEQIAECCNQAGNLFTDEKDRQQFRDDIEKLQRVSLESLAMAKGETD